eukprot:CAMPEP_0176468070 /NCGR_PEP_ID=MMETSP0127-20121128/38822_1 /TAXON_ID=938130 /ORGANISM="Platyophrya macrostoma, Strain WH" /LENGTH=401 /DNA_ID=CAMNT_0017861465 /DNA_START=27 /DNA_END=1232 /DNA_ORIENTATION=+
MSYSKYFSGSQVESDQKDLIVSQLKAEIFDLRQNERDYHDLSSQLRTLEHRFNLLQEEKTRNDADYKHRNDTNLRTIANLKTDVDTLKATIEEKNIEYQENKAENLAIRDIAEHRASDISKLKNELSVAVDQNARNKEQKRDLETQLNLAREEKRKLIANNDAARANADELVYRTNELEKVLRELEYDRNRVEKQQQQLHSGNENLNHELRAKNETLRNVEQQINEAERKIYNLETDIKELERANEKGRAEVAALQRSLQQEVSRNLELNAKINNNENILRSREVQIDDYKKDLEQLKQAHNNMIDTNYQLNEDIQNLQRQIDALAEQNAQIVAELEAFSQTDEHIRHLLNRKNKVNELKYSSEAKTKGGSAIKGGTELKSGSPGRKLRTPGYSSRRSPYK